MNQNLQTQTAISDDSYLELPHKPNQKSELNSQRMMLPRKGSEQTLKTIHNIKISVNSSIQLQDCTSQSKEFGSLIVLSEGSDHIARNESRCLDANHYSIIGSQNAYNSNQKTTNRNQIKSPQQQQHINTINSVRASNDIKTRGSVQIKDKRSSINSYNKRVVELHLNQHNQSKDNLLRVAPQTMKNQSIKQLSLDISEIPGLTSTEINKKFNDLKQDIITTKQIQQTPVQCSSALQSHEKIKPQIKVIPISTNISPKNQNAFGSPRYSINSVNNTITKSKLMIRKQLTNTNKNGIINLNRSDQQNGNTNITQDPAIVVNQSQSIHCFKQNSPQFNRFVQQSKTNQNSTLKKNTQNQNQSNSQLLRNISQDHKQLRVSESHRDLHSNKVLESQRLQNPQIFENKRESQKYYSPTQMTLNKALSRISSVGELTKVKQQIASQRKSIQNKLPTTNASGLSTIFTAHIVMNNAQRKNTDTLQQSKSQERSQFQVIEQQKQSDEDEDNDYMTNQERLWNAIETNQELKFIEDLLKKGDVNISLRNIFDDGWTALHYAVHEGNTQVVKLLIETYKAQVDVRSATNKTPFHLACIRGDEVLIRYLLDNGVSPHVVDRDGCTPLHYLCETENHEMVKLLLPLCGASKDVRNRFGKKPVDLIQDKDIKKLLRNFSTRRESLNTRTNNQQNMQQPQSQSRERSKSSNHNIVQIHRLNDDKEVQESISQMFRKFSQYQRKSSKENLPIKTQLNDDSKVHNPCNTQRNLISPQSQAVNASKRIQNPPSRLTIGNQTQKQQIPSSMPNSSKNVKKINLPQKIMFPQSSQNLIQKNLSPNKNIQINIAKTNSLNSSQSQRNLNSKPALQNNKSTGKIDTKRLTSIQSVTNLFQEKQKLIEQKKLEQQELSNRKDDDYSISNMQKKIIKNPQIKSQNQEINQLSDNKLEESVSQRTGDSSHINNELNSNSVVNKNHKLTTFSLNQLSDAQDNVNTDEKQNQEQQKIGPWSFIAHQLLGTGSFGEVFLVEKISNGKFYAMKVLTKQKIMGHNLTRYALTERNVMSIVNHPFIVKLNYAFQTQEKLYLILDYCPGGDLAEYLQLEKRFNEDKVRLYSSEILLGLEELHRKDIIFRDLKPDNVVLDSEGHAMLTDFGLSKEGVMKEGQAKSFCGSYAYLAPEMLKKIGHGKAVDWYLLGVIIYEMLCGIPPYYANNKEELFENIRHAALDIPTYISPCAKDIMLRLLNRNPKKRLGTIGGAEEIKKHPFFKNIDWKKLYNRAYKAPEPYLRKRFENFLQMSPALQTNTEVYEQLRQQAQYKGPGDADKHIPGWSFVSPVKENE